MLYSSKDSSAQLSSALYRISTDSSTGGYRFVVDQRVAASDTNAIVPGERRPCGDTIPDGVTRSTIPLPVSPYHALVVQMNGGDQAPAPALLQPVKGAFALEFLDQGAIQLTIQILQLASTDDKLDLKILAPKNKGDIGLTTIGNKDFSLREIDAQGRIGGQRSADSLGVFASNYPGGPTALFDYLRRIQVRIYPAFARIDTYRGGFLRLELKAADLSRGLSKGATVKALDGATAFYYLRSEPTKGILGKLVGGQQAKVVEPADDQGQLIVSVGGPDAIIESWLVDVVTENGSQI